MNTLHGIIMSPILQTRKNGTQRDELFQAVTCNRSTLGTHVSDCWAPESAFYSHCTIPLSAAAKSLQSCPTLCDPIDGSPPGSAVPGILQARTLEWVAIPSQCMKVKSESEVASRARLLATPRTAAHQAPPSMGFSRQEYWSALTVLNKK